MKVLKSKIKKSNLLSIWWFLVLVIVAIGITIGVYIFYGHRLDVRFMEADILSNRIIGCISSNGLIDHDFEYGSFNIFEKCSLNEKVLRSNNDYFIRISLSQMDSGKLVKEEKIGAASLEADCKVAAATESAQKYPRCSEKELVLYNALGERFKLLVICASNNEKEKF